MYKHTEEQRKRSNLNTKHWQEEHRENYLARRRQRYVENRQILLDKKHIYDATVNGRFSILLRSAKVRNFEVGITLQQYTKLISTNQCYYCGSPLPKRGSGLDRIDNSKGYIIGNIRTCCQMCNEAKNSYTEVEFKAWLQRIAVHYLGLGNQGVLSISGAQI
jgi:hypothetical protein